jgi:hypothetical protein
MLLTRLVSLLMAMVLVAGPAAAEARREYEIALPWR